MVRPIGPISWSCTSCGWKHIATPNSDVLTRGHDHFDTCPKCGKDTLESEMLTGAAAPLVSAFSQLLGLMGNKL